MAERPRPLSPFMHYRWLYTNTLSILHRITGVLLGSMACFCFHLLNGIRHLCFDFGLGFELPAARKSALAVSIGSVLLTLLLCAVLWTRLGGTS